MAGNEVKPGCTSVQLLWRRFSRHQINGIHNCYVPTTLGFQEEKQKRNTAAFEKASKLETVQKVKKKKRNDEYEVLKPYFPFH